MSEFNFLRSFVSLFEGTEVHERFANWSGLSTISAMLERRIWVDMGVYQVYPNMYNVFVGRSGDKKSTAIKLAQKLLGQVSPGPRMLSQSITASALIDALRSARTDEVTKLIHETCGGMLIADELKTFLNQDNYKSLAPYLIPFYDCNDTMSYHTRSHGIESVDYVHLSLLAGTTINSLRLIIPVTALEDGLASRMIFVHVIDKEAPPPIPRPKYNPQRVEVEESLIKHLQSLASLSGPIQIADDAGKFFDDEYIRLHKTSKFSNTPFSGYAKRRDKHLLKVAICIMLATKPPEPLVLSEDHLRGAKTYLDDIERRMLEILDLISTTDKGDLIDKVYQSIKLAGDKGMLRSEALRKFSHKGVDAYELEKIIDTLKKAKRIKQDTNAATGKVVYIRVKESSDGEESE